MHTHSLADYVKCIGRDDLAGVGELVLDSANRLAAIGANFLICPDNAIHRALRYVQARSSLPWLHIAEVVAYNAVARGFRCLGLTGTTWLIASEVYPEKLTPRGIQFVRPSDAEGEEINRIIMEDLVYGEYKSESTAYFQRVIGRMKQQGCDAVVLGCTEIPLLISDLNSPVPTLDSTRVLARAALCRALEPATAAAAVS